jgi:hypothetical protein
MTACSGQRSSRGCGNACVKRLCSLFSPNLGEFSRHFKYIICRGNPRFESWRPSQPPRSLAGDFLNFAKSRHFRRLVAKTLVFGEESRLSCAESLKSRGQSLRTDFSISEICVKECPETGLCSLGDRFEPSASDADALRLPRVLGCGLTAAFQVEAPNADPLAADNPLAIASRKPSS